MNRWRDVRNELNITPEEENVIELEKDLIISKATEALANDPEHERWCQAL